MGEIPTESDVRAFKVLEYRYFEIKNAIRKQLRELRESLIHIDHQRSSIEIHQTLDGMNLHAYIGGLAYSFR
jgi:hypothetical protein